MRGAALLGLLVLYGTGASAAAAKDGQKIKHVVVVMEENRSFDHMLGWRKGVNGVRGDECNALDTTDPSSKKVCVTKAATQVSACDPNHGTPATTEKIFGKRAVAGGDYSNPSMSGFAEYEAHHTKYCQVLDLHPPENVPIMNALADEYVLMDRFFASVPGPTWPNRMFALSATSAGLTSTGPWYHNKRGQLFPQKTFMDQIVESGLTWKNYYNDTPWEMFMDVIAHNPENTVSMERFWEDARTGDLPAFAWINPRSGINVTTGVGSNDQHPDHDLAAGEAFYKDIYEALRASPAWNETLMIVTYDEHGGYWDHVPTPLDVPAPGDGEASYPDKFAFDRLGVRIPTLLVSPWLAKGAVLSEPPAAQKPAGNSEYDLTSIMATARILLGMDVPALTARDAWAGTFEHLFDVRDTPRADCPAHLPAAVPPQKAALAQEATAPVNSLQDHIITLHAHHAGAPYPAHIAAQKDVSPWLAGALAAHRARKAATYPVVVVPGSDTWKFTHAGGAEHAPTGAKATVSTTVDGVAYCLDGGSLADGEAVSASPCGAVDPADPAALESQLFFWGADASIRAVAAPGLCVDQVVGPSTEWIGTRRTQLAPCAERVTQRYAYHGKAPGMPYSGSLNFGDGASGLKLQK